jgi:hypothetical protein
MLRNALTVVVCLALALQAPCLAVTSVERGAVSSEAASGDVIEAGYYSDREEKWIEQRLLVAPGEDGSSVFLRYERGGVRAAEAKLELFEGLAVWTTRIGENTLRIERSLDGLAVTNRHLRVTLNGVPVPAFGEWFTDVYERFADLTPEELEREIHSHAWPEEILALLDQPDRYVIVSRELSDMIELWRSMLSDHPGAAGHGVMSCVWCAAGVVSHLAATGVALAIGAPTGGLAFYAWIISRYSSIAATIGACVACGVYLEAKIEESEEEKPNRH